MADRNQIMGLVLEHLKDSSQPIDISQVVDALKGEAPEEAIRGAILKLIDTQQLLIDENMQLLNSHVLVK